MSTWMQTASRNQFDFDHMRYSDIHIQDIAWHLSGLPRFTNATRCSYSVAEHSCRVSDKLPERLRFAGLIHDAHEAYTGDPSTPWKNHVGPVLIEAERRVAAFVRGRFGLPAVLPVEVEEVDHRMCSTEARDMLPGGPVDDWHINHAHPYADFRFLTPWDSERSYNEFLKRYETLTGESC